jgi:glycosyltransferase involved in cell wall biosynthesis
MAGVPVVVSRGNEQCRLVTAEGVGRCADIDDPADVAREIAALLRAPAEERRRMRDHCRALALSRYTWEGTAGDLITLYRRLAAA